MDKSKLTEREWLQAIRAMAPDDARWFAVDGYGDGKYWPTDDEQPIFDYAHNDDEEGEWVHDNIEPCTSAEGVVYVVCIGDAFPFTPSDSLFDLSLDDEKCLSGD